MQISWCSERQTLHETPGAHDSSKSIKEVIDVLQLETMRTAGGGGPAFFSCALGLEPSMVVVFGQPLFTRNMARVKRVKHYF